MLSGWKTLITALAVSIFGVLASADWTTILHNPQTAGYVVTGIGVVMAGLRFITNGPAAIQITASTPPAPPPPPSTKV